MLHKAEISEIVWLEYRITCLFYSKLLKYSSRYKYLPSHPQSIFSFSHIVLFNNFYVSYIREIKYQVYRRLTYRVFLYFFCHFFHFDKSTLWSSVIISQHFISACCYFEHIAYINANINKQVRAGVDDELYILNEVYLMKIDAHTSHDTTEKK